VTHAWRRTFRKPTPIAKKRKKAEDNGQEHYSPHNDVGDFDPDNVKDTNGRDEPDKD